jgi:hypothetical protein
VRRGEKEMAEFKNYIGGITSISYSREKLEEANIIKGSMRAYVKELKEEGDIFKKF